MATPLQVLQSDTYQQAILGEGPIPVAWFRDVHEALEQVLSARSHLEAVADAARVIRGLSRIGLLATEADYDMLADAHDALAAALDALDKDD